MLHELQEMDVTWGYGGQFMTTKPEDQTHLHTIVTPLYPRGSLKSLLDKYEKVRLLLPADAYAGPMAGACRACRLIHGAFAEWDNP